jgi:glycosyltransferase involved in cell wall biosynthesis
VGVPGAVGVTGVTGTSARTRIVLLIHRAGIGGVERRLSILAEAFESAGVACTFVALAGAETTPSLLDHRQVTVLDPVRSRTPWRNLRRWWRLRQLLSTGTYNALLTYGHHANALGALAAAGMGRRVIMSEVLNPFVRHRRWWNRTAMWSYRLADVLVMQTEQLASDLRRRLPAPRQTTVIPNPLHPSAIIATPIGSREQVIVGLGRLVPTKRYHDLITAFARVAAEFPSWRVRIIGDGPERPKLRALSEQLGVASQVELDGAITSPWPELRRASILVHCAEIEGFCNTVIEGLASGCAVISSDCSYGPPDILANGEGLLYPVGDLDALTRHLRRMMGDEPSRIALAQRGHASTGRFSLEENVRQWLSVVIPGPMERT